jgi:hypothetical protein
MSDMCMCITENTHAQMSLLRLYLKVTWRTNKIAQEAQAASSLPGINYYFFD